MNIIEHANEQISDTKYIFENTLTLCILTTVNGFKVVGESNVIDPKKYDKLKGMETSRMKAFNKLVDILAYSFKG